MELALRACYRIEMLPIICSFVTETARAFGATAKEASELCLAAEETVVSILEHFPSDDAAAFEVTCRTRADGVEYVFNNLGLPVNVEALPRYEASAPDESIDSPEGLRLFLARKMVDELAFVNRGHDGWSTRIVKHLAAPQALPPPPSRTQAVTAVADKMTVSVATAADAHDIVKLAYLTYRYSFTKIAFYYADLLSAELTTGRIRSFVGRTREGRIVAHITRMIDPQCPVVAELGAVMIRPEYRQSSSLLLLVRAVIRDRDAYSEQMVCYTADLVTGHILSQKLCAIFAFHPMALKLSTHDRARFLDIDTPDGQRETTLYAVRLQQEVPPFALCVPAEHGAIAARLFANAGLAPAISSAAGEPAVPSMDWSVQHDDSAHYVQLTALAWGADFQPSFKRILFELTRHTVATTSLLLPAWAPPPPALDGFLNDQGFFFGGFVHATPQRWFIKYARLTGQRFSFDEVRIHDPVADELKSYVRLCYERLIP